MEDHRTGKRVWALETTTEYLHGSAIVTPRGRIGSESARDFGAALAAARSRSSRLIVDLAGVDYISGPGLTALADAAAAADAVFLCGITEAVRNTLDLGGLLETVQIEENRQAAINRLQEIGGA